MQARKAATTNWCSRPQRPGAHVSAARDGSPLVVPVRAHVRRCVPSPAPEPAVPRSRTKTLGSALYSVPEKLPTPDVQVQVPGYNTLLTNTIHVQVNWSPRAQSYPVWCLPHPTSDPASRTPAMQVTPPMQWAILDYYSLTRVYALTRCRCPGSLLKQNPRRSGADPPMSHGVRVSRRRARKQHC